MLEIAVASSDLGRVRFVSDPLWEAASSLFALHCPNSRAVHHRLRSLVEDTPAASMRVLHDLCGDPNWVPDLLAPEPDPDLSGEVEPCLRRIADADLKVVERDLAVLRARPEPPPCADLDAVAFREAVADSLVAFWRAVLDPLWDRARLVTDADIAHRSEQLAADGLSATLSDLHDRVIWAEDALRVDCPPDVTVSTSGGMWLIPSVFRWPGFAVQYETPRPVLCYAARGSGRVWAVRDGPADAVGNLLGRGRARVLSAVALPASTTEVADLLDLSKGTVSEHLTALADVRLVSSRRSGRRVLYSRTALGDRLLG